MELMTKIVTQLVVSAGLRFETVEFQFSLLKQESLTFLKSNEALFRKSLEFPHRCVCILHSE